MIVRVCVALVFALGVSSDAAAQRATCRLGAGGGGEYRGLCDGATWVDTIAVSRNDAEGFAWTGTLRTAYGTFPVYLAPPGTGPYPTGVFRMDRVPVFDALDSFAVSADSLSFGFVWYSGAPAGEVDRSIVERTREILTTSGWTPEDPDDCPDPGRPVGLGCGLRQASIETVGYSHPQQPAASLAGLVISEIADGRDGVEDIASYNRHPDTTSDEVFEVLDRVAAWMGAGFRLSSGNRLSPEQAATAAVTLADVDADADLDILFANGRHWPATNRILLNSGSGDFKVERPLGIDGAASYRIVLADFDGDGDLDAADVNDRSPNHLFRNDGTGRFALAGTFGAPDGNTRDLEVGDLDGDGDADLFVLNRDSSSEICFNDGRAGFDDCRPFEGEPSAIKVALGDMNEDGALDVVLANQAGHENHVYLNDGTGGFADPHPFGTGRDETLSVAVGDLDGDGHLDIATANVNQPGGVYYGDGRGGFVAGPTLGSGYLTYRVTIADVNADGRLDLLFANAWHANGLYVNRGRREGFDELWFGSPRDGTYGLAVSDLNGDGAPDIVEANDGTENKVFYGRIR